MELRGKLESRSFFGSCRESLKKNRKEKRDSKKKIESSNDGIPQFASFQCFWKLFSRISCAFSAIFLKGPKRLLLLKGFLTDSQRLAKLHPRSTNKKHAQPLFLLNLFLRILIYTEDFSDEVEALVMTTLPVVSVTVLVNASGIMPVNADSLLDANGGDESCKADREAAEQKFDQALTVSSHSRGVPPGFVSTKVRVSISSTAI